jgi:hypothetical protein
MRIRNQATHAGASQDPGASTCIEGLSQTLYDVRDLDSSEHQRREEYTRDIRETLPGERQAPPSLTRANYASRNGFGNRLGAQVPRKLLRLRASRVPLHLGDAAGGKSGSAR